jgi:hypothetical protein
MNKIFYLITVLLIISSITFAQEENHRWKKLDTITGEQIWFDVSFSDTLQGDKFDVWVLKVHTPPMKSEGVEGDIFRSKILYSINLATVRYGIMKLRYYDVKNSKLYSFDYDTPPPPTDALRYPYPVLEESPLYLIIKEIFKDQENSTK